MCICIYKYCSCYGHMKHFFVTWLLKCTNVLDQSTICIICRGTGWKGNGVWHKFNCTASRKEQLREKNRPTLKHIKEKPIRSSHFIKTQSVNPDTFWNTSFITKLLLQIFDISRLFKFFKLWGHPWPGQKPGKYVPGPWSTCMKDHHFGRFVKTSRSFQERLIKRSFYSTHPFIGESWNSGVASTMLGRSVLRARKVSSLISVPASALPTLKPRDGDLVS